MSIEAMKMALAVLDGLYIPGGLDRVNKVITALRTAIAAPVQEPVAWVFRRSLIQKFRWHRDKPVGQEALLYWEPLYTTPPAAQRQPLTDDQIESIFMDHGWSWGERADMYIPVARAIEAEHGITGESK
jgi:hypothetical protein